MTLYAGIAHGGKARALRSDPNAPPGAESVLLSANAAWQVGDVLLLRPGERIKQDELANELDISRIPVRDALRILETRGLVSLKANTGARVTSRRRSGPFGGMISP